MTAGRDGRPEQAEQIPYFLRYIDLVPAGDILTILQEQLPMTLEYCAQLSAAAAAQREASGEWNAIEIIGHVADTERVLAYRALRLARGDEAMPEGVEFEQYNAAAQFGKRELADVVAEFATVRAATLAFLAGLPAGAWARQAPEVWASRTVRSLAYIIAGHELHHLYDIQRQQAG